MVDDDVPAWTNEPHYTVRGDIVEIHQDRFFALLNHLDALHAKIAEQDKPTPWWNSKSPWEM